MIVAENGAISNTPDLRKSKKITIFKVTPILKIPLDIFERARKP
jgi:hypothetical protein